MLNHCGLRPHAELGGASTGKKLGQWQGKNVEEKGGAGEEEKLSLLRQLNASLGATSSKKNAQGKRRPKERIKNGKERKRRANSKNFEIVRKRKDDKNNNKGRREE